MSIPCGAALFCKLLLQKERCISLFIQALLENFFPDSSAGCCKKAAVGVIIRL